MRLFVAIDLPETLRERLSHLSGGVPGARWVDADNMHLTLRFIGEVENGLAKDIDSALMKVQAPCFDIHLDGVGFYGKSRTARVLWAGVEKSEALSHLQAKVETAVRTAGVPPEERKFSPHVTLARLRKAPPARLQRFVAEHANFVSETVPVDRFVLYSSFRSASGPIYTPEAEYSLAG